MPTPEGPNPNRPYRSKGSWVRRVEQVRPQPPSPATIKESPELAPLALTPPPARGSFKRVRAERVSGAGGGGRQECGTPTGARGLKPRRRPPPTRPARVVPLLLPGPHPQLRRAPSLATPVHRRARTSMLGAQSSPGPRIRPTPVRPSEAAGWGNTGRSARPHPHSGGSASRRPPERDKGCSAAGRTVPDSPLPPPWWPPTRPPSCLLRRARLHSPDGFQEEEAAATSLGPCTPDPPLVTPEARAPFSASSGQLRGPRLLVRAGLRGAFPRDPSSGAPARILTCGQAPAGRTCQAPRRAGLGGRAREGGVLSRSPSRSPTTHWVPSG